MKHAIAPMRLSRALLPVLAASMFLFAFPLAAPNADAQGTSSLSGTVCTSDPYYGYPGEPSCTNRVAGATLTLTRPAVAGIPATATQSTTTSDADGKYQFSNLADGEHNVKVTRQGFQDLDVKVTVAGATTKELLLAPKDVTVNGKLVHAETGAAVATGTVSTCCTVAGEYKQAQAASDGSFTLTVAAGMRWVSVYDAAGFQSYGANLFLDGSDITLELEPVPPQDARLQGRMTDQNGNALAGIRVDVYAGCCVAYAEPACMECASSSPAYYGGSNHTLTGADGRYSIGVYGGSSAQISVNIEGYASYYAYVDVPQDATVTHDIALVKFPEKTARVEGRLVDADTGKAVRFGSVNAQAPRYGIHECSAESSQSSSTAADAPAKMASPGIAYYDPGCRITMQADGTFVADLTPGYTIFTVWVDNYRSCTETRDADGSSVRTCGPEYFSFSKVIDLPANTTTKVDLALTARAAPNAVLSGYLVSDGEGLAGARIYVYSEENGGWGHAATDEHGSYKLRLRAGYHQVSVDMEGHLPWQGVFVVRPGDNALDVHLTKGQAAGYGCCYGPMPMEGKDGAVATTPGGPNPGAAQGSTGGVPPASPPSGLDEGSTGNMDGAGAQYEDLGGGLGPYDASRRGDGDVASNKAPFPALALALAVLCLAGWLRRNK